MDMMVALFQLEPMVAVNDRHLAEDAVDLRKLIVAFGRFERFYKCLL
jgi:hypothetical protein